MALATTAEEVQRLFASSGKARSDLARWRRRKPRVADRVLQHVSITPYKLRSEQFSRFIPGHPLRRVSAHDAYQVQAIRDFYPDYAMVHLFHFLLEKKGNIFTFKEFREFCKSEDAGKHFSHQCQDKIRSLVDTQGWSQEAAIRSMMWRVGNGYYSFLRELYLVCRLREAGLDARIHPLADALFRVDAWCGRTVMEMFIANRNFKQGKEGRKRSPQHFLGDQQGFEFVRLEMKPQHEFGTLHLPTENEVKKCIAQLLELRRRREQGRRYTLP